MCAVQPQPTPASAVRSSTQLGNVVVGTEQLGKTIDDRRILHAINLNIHAGEFIALLGANGAGKTTLLKIIATLIPLTAGKLEIFGTPIGKDNTKVRAQLGLIGHGTMLYRDLGILENLIFFGRLYGLSNPKQRAEDLLHQVGLYQRRLDPVSAMSRGMAQRASIARALMHDPELLLADEPFAGLDAPSAHMLEGVLTELNVAGKTIILVNHNVPQSLELASKAVVIRQGQVVVNESTTDLTPAGVLREVSGA